jgi:hypothetical protein
MSKTTISYLHILLALTRFHIRDKMKVQRDTPDFRSTGQARLVANPVLSNKTRTLTIEQRTVKQNDSSEMRAPEKQPNRQTKNSWTGV